MKETGAVLVRWVQYEGGIADTGISVHKTPKSALGSAVLNQISHRSGAPHMGFQPLTTDEGRSLPVWLVNLAEEPGLGELREIMGQRGDAKSVFLSAEANDPLFRACQAVITGTEPVNLSLADAPVPEIETGKRSHRQSHRPLALKL